MPLLPRDIKELLAPVKMMASKNALSAVYRSLEISETMVRACSSFGIIEIDMKLGVGDTVYVDAATFLAVVDSLPGDKELVLEQDKGALAWQCGNASGRLALAVIERMPDIGEWPEGDPIELPEGFAASLTLGSMSCTTMALASLGMHGVAIDGGTAGQLTLNSSDNITISSATIAAEGAWPKLLTIAPQAAELLAEVIAKDGAVMFSDTAIYYWDDGTRLMLKLAAPLKHNLSEVVEKFYTAETIVPLPRDAVGAFIKRVGAIADTKKDAIVTLHAMDGQLALSFAENVAVSDEYFLVDGLVVGAQLDIKLDATRLARVLAEADEICLDHLTRNTLLFYGQERSFVYLVSGQK